MSPSEHFTKTAWLLGILTLLVGILYLAKAVLIPLSLAVLLSFVLSPVCDRIERRGLGRIPAVLLTALFGFSLVGITAWGAVAQLEELAPNLPEYRVHLVEKFQSTTRSVADGLGELTRTAEEVGRSLPPSESAAEPQGTDDRPFSVRVVSPPASPLQLLNGVFGTLLEAAGSIGLVVILVIFFLLSREDLRDRFIRLMGKGRLTVTTQMLEDAAVRVSRYLSMLLVVNVTFGLAVGAGLVLIGVPNALLWGVLATLLRFIPYIGPWIAAALPIALSMAISSDWGPPLGTIALFLVLELFSNNVMEPWLYGKHTGISSVAVLLSALFWTWLWGIPGLLLATPLTVCLLVIGKHVPDLAFLDVLLGDEPVLEPKRRVYQRLLAGDQEEASELFEAELVQKPLAEVLDTLLIPALALAEVHWRRGDLDEHRHTFILQCLVEMIDSGVPVKPASAAETDAPLARLLCVPARDEADAIAGTMLAQLLASDGYLVEIVPLTVTAPEILNQIERDRPNVVCISSTPPAALTHARHLCRRLRARFPDLPVVVGLWNTQSDLTKAKQRIGEFEQTHVVATLTDAQAQIQALIQPNGTLAEPTPPEPELADVASRQRDSAGSKSIPILH